MQKIKSTVGAVFGLTPVETEVLIQSMIVKLQPALLILARLLFIVGFVCCLITYPLPAVFIGVLGYYLVELETRIDLLERKAKEQEKYYPR